MQVDYNLTGNPFKNLWAAVVMNALDDLTPIKRAWPGEIKNPEKRGQAVNRRELSMAQAANFFKSKNSNLPWICEKLDIDLTSVRAAAVRILNGERPPKQYKSALVR